MNRPTIADSVCWLVCLLLPLPALWLSPLGPWGNGIPNADSGVFSYMGSALLQGTVPYRDLFDHKGLLLYVINAAGYALNGMRGIWLMEWLALATTALLLFPATRLFTGRFTALLATAVVLASLVPIYEYGNYTSIYALPFQSAALYLAARRWQLKEPFTFAQAFLYGLCLGAVLLLQPNLIAVFAALGLVLLVSALRDKQGKELLRFAGGGTLGLALVLAAAGMYLYSRQALGDAIFQYLTFNFTYVRVPLHDKIRGGFVTLVQISRNHLLLLSLLAGAGYLATRRNERHYLALFLLLYWILAFAANCLSGKGVGHYAIAYLPAGAIPAALVFRFLFRALRSMPLDRAWARTLLGGFSLLFFWPLYWYLAGAAPRSHDPNPEYDRIAALTKSGHTLCVLGNDSYLYLKTGLAPFSKYHFADPILLYSGAMMDEYFDLLEKRKPDYLVIDKVVSDEEPFHSHVVFNRHLEEVMPSYQLVEKTGRYRIFRRNSP